MQQALEQLVRQPERMMVLITIRIDKLPETRSFQTRVELTSYGVWMAAHHELRLRRHRLPGMLISHSLYGAASCWAR